MSKLNHQNSGIKEVYESKSTNNHDIIEQIDTFKQMI